jgi:hypothetical protein
MHKPTPASVGFSVQQNIVVWVSGWFCQALSKWGLVGDGLYARRPAQALRLVCSD